MSKEFYNYLADKTIHFFRESNIRSGEKFILKFENQEEVDGFYSACKKSLESQQEFTSYRFEGGRDYEDYNAIGLLVGETVIVVVPEIDITNAYLTTLRNLVGNGTAMLVVCHNPIDSISGGTDSLQREGMPFHKNQLISDIEHKVNKSALYPAEKEVLLFDLKNRKRDSLESNNSLDDYSDLIDVLHKGKIEKADFHNFNMFCDIELSTILGEVEIKGRIQDNYDLHKKLDEIVKYGDLERELERIIDDQLISRIKNAASNENWDDGISYNECKNSQKKHDKKLDPLTIENIQIAASDTPLHQNRDYYIRDGGESPSKTRIKHILIFNPDHLSKFEIIATTSEFLGSGDISRKRPDPNIVVEIKGKKLITTIAHSGCTINQVSLKLSARSETMRLNFCIINGKNEWFNTISTVYFIGFPKSPKAPGFLQIGCQDVLLFNESQKNGRRMQMAHGMNLEYSETEYVELVADEYSFDDTNEIDATLTLDGNEISIKFVTILPQQISVSGIGIEKRKLFSKQNFLYRGNNKLVLGTHEFNTREELKDNLVLEELFIQNRFLHCVSHEQLSLTAQEIDVGSSVSKAYGDFIDYFSANSTLPSLAYYDANLLALGQCYVDAVLAEFLKMENEKPLSAICRNLLCLGTIAIPSKKQILFTPLHPINVAYQLQLAKENLDEEPREDMLKKLYSMNLLPFIHDEDAQLYQRQDQIHSPQWSYYALSYQCENKGNREFVPSLVSEKISDFIDHFQYLFNHVGGNKLIVNAINMGDCKNLFKGIASYLYSQLSNGMSPSDLITIEINIYNTKQVYSVFEALSQRVALKHVFSGLDLRISSTNMSENEFLNILPSKIKYYRKTLEDNRYEYAHLAFIEMDQITKNGHSNKKDMRSGSMLDGLLSGVASMYYAGDNESYRTGYGSKYSTTSNTLLYMSEFYNSMMLAYGSANPYNENNAICTVIDRKETDVIEKTYDSSNWVVFIDPKVDLHFFKNADLSKDVMIIHYSDQHTTSSSYDAITVTRKTQQYEDILEEFLHNKTSGTVQREQIRKTIDMFNAVNGDWLLKLISSKDTFSKEKISIHSAIKLALAYFRHPDIVWIPISMEEIVRVSGSSGLSKRDGFFSAKNLGYDRGVTSDDLLMFGIEKRGESILVHLYPLEVKIGYKDIDERGKAIEQIKKTRKILDEKLSDSAESRTLQSKVYRNFIANLAIVSAEKLALYNVWDSQDWDAVINSDTRGKLLNDQFEISTELNSEIGDGIVISFKRGIYIRDIGHNDNTTILRFLYSDGTDYITKPVDDIIQELDNISDAKDNMLCYSSYGIETEAEETISAHLQPLDIILVADEVVVSLDDENAKDSTISENTSKVESGMEILFGHDSNNGQPLYWYPNDTEKIMHPNTGIIGTMGTGKTQFTKSVILQLTRAEHNNPGDEPLGILIFDYKGDYNLAENKFAAATNAKVYPLSDLPFNPFSLPLGKNLRAKLPLHVANTFKETISIAYNLGPKQEAILLNTIMSTYHRKGIDPNKPETWSCVPPTFYDVFATYENDETIKKDDSLFAALNNINMFGIFEPDPGKTKSLYDLINGVVVVDLSGYSADLQNTVVAITLDLFYNQMQVFGHSRISGKLRQLRKFILVDEADNFLRVGFTSIRKILKEGREFGVGTILSTQFLKHFYTSDDDYSKYIYSWIVHNVADLSVKDVKNLFNTSSRAEEEELFSSIKKLKKHYSFVKYGGSSRAYYIKDLAFWEICAREQRERNL